jgi:hypothetical protein
MMRVHNECCKITPYLAIQLKEGGCIVDVKSVPNPVEVKAACYEFCRL